MANTIKSGLPSAASLTGVELLPAVQSGSTTQATVNQVKTYVNTAPVTTGGSINSTPIGATTPSTGAFTTLTASGNLYSGSSTASDLSAITGLAIKSALPALILQGTEASAARGFLIENSGSLYSGLGTTTITQLSSTGLAVTGNISSTARTLVGTTTDDGVNALQVNGAVKSSGNVLGAIGTVQFIAQSAVTPHSSSNAGSITFGISDGGGNIASGVSSGVRVNNIWSSPYSSQSIDFLTSHGGTSVSTVRANIGIDGLFSIYNGLAVTGNISATGTIAPQQATTAGAPAYVKGAIYFDTTLNKLRVGGATAWETITSV